MLKTVAVEDSIGMVLPHDITEIVRGSHKKCAFKKGHVIRNEDIPHLKRLGKDHMYILTLESDEIHENEAAEILAQALAGEGVALNSGPEEGKITLTAANDGLLRVNIDSLLQFNLLGDVMCSTLHDNTPVRRGEILAGTRLIPLVGKRSVVDQAAKIASRDGHVLRVLRLKSARCGLVITGNEVFYGRIKDQFEAVLRKKLESLGSTVQSVEFAPDNPGEIATAIHRSLAGGADLVVTSGGLSVDPDDVTRAGIIAAGAADTVYGSPVLPGAMFFIGRIGAVPLLGVPACGMYHKITVLDLVLPRVLAGEAIGRRKLAALGHGGLCRNCPTCTYPACSFGK